MLSQRGISFRIQVLQRVVVRYRSIFYPGVVPETISCDEKADAGTGRKSPQTEAMTVGEVGIGQVGKDNDFPNFRR